MADWDKFGNRRMIPTGESIVFLSKDGSVFTKMKSPFSKAPLEQSHPGDIIYEHLIHNMLFPGTSTGSSEFQKIIKESESSCSKRTYHLCLEFLPPK